MPSFDHDGVEIAFFDEGEGEPIVLVHGFGSNKEVNWVAPGLGVDADAGRAPRHRARQSRPWRLDQALRSGRLPQRADGRRRAGADRSSWAAACRRHGLLDGRAEHDLPGASRNPEHLRSAVLGGVGGHLVGGVGLSPDVIVAGARSAVARRRDRSDRLSVPQLRRADQVRPARARRLPARLAPAAGSAERWPGSPTPVLVAVGTRDQIAGPPAELAALIPGAQALAIPDRDHMLAVGDRTFKAGVLAIPR